MANAADAVANHIAEECNRKVACRYRYRCGWRLKNELFIRIYQVAKAKSV